MVAIDVLFVNIFTFIVEDVNNMGISKGVSVFVVVDAVKVDTPVFLVKLGRVRPTVPKVLAGNTISSSGLAAEVISGVILAGFLVLGLLVYSGRLSCAAVGLEYEGKVSSKCSPW